MSAVPSWPIAPLPMVVRQTISVGFDRTGATASAIAASSAARSWPSTGPITCQPQARNRAGVSSANQPATSPSMLMPLSSYSATSLPRRSVPASEITSWLMPSIRQPSPMNTQVRWSTMGRPSRLNSAASICSASAIPTALARPWPSGPVVVSTPGVMPTSGWPGVLLPIWRKRLISSIDRS